MDRVYISKGERNRSVEVGLFEDLDDYMKTDTILGTWITNVGVG